ncbi:MAG: dihydrodipicolinate synthase family protein [SAR202 cluster bacterium]|nr:dihydrodipicolinate synthase family protein [SAR202 cluster bacterium]
MSGPVSFGGEKAVIDRSLKGLYPILSMPFDAKGRIDEEDLRRETEFAISAGVHGVGIAMASEVFKLSEAERDLALRTVVAQTRGRVKVVMHSSAPGTNLAIKYSRRAEKLGADAVMVTPPTALPMPPTQVVEYFQELSDAITIPIFVQDIGSAPVPPHVVAEIARTAENACYAKVETPPTPPRVAEATRLGGDAVIVFGGAGGRALIGELRNGSVGTMPGCAIPEVFHKVWDLYHEGKVADAEALLTRNMPMLDMYKESLDVSYHLTKEVLRLRRVFKSTYVRHPTIPPGKAAIERVQRLVEELGLAVI